MFDDLLPLYPGFFRVILDPARGDLPDVRPVRDDLAPIMEVHALSRVARYTRAP